MTTPSSKIRDVVYSSRPELRSPGRLFGEMLRDLRASQPLAWRLVVRDIASQYRQTALGYLWAVFPALVTSVTFIFLNSSNVISTGNTGIPYAAYVVMGTVFFGLFSDALTSPLRVATAAKSMLVRINFPREALLLSAVGQVLFAFIIKLALLAVVLLVLHVGIAATAPVAFLPLAGLLAIGTMLGILIVPIGMLYQDFAYGVAIVASAVMLFSPVAYPVPSNGAMHTAMTLNPLTPLLESARECVVSGQFTHLVAACSVLAASLVLILVGWVIFRVALPIIVERAGS
jgi:lipopolysaccharide transport system permease protein